MGRLEPDTTVFAKTNLKSVCADNRKTPVATMLSAVGDKAASKIAAIHGSNEE